MSSGTSSPRPRTESRLLLLFAFACIYLIWGSTYLAIRYAVETIPPLITAGVRHLVAGSVLFAWAWFRGFRPTRREWAASLVLGVLWFLIGHGSLHWAETRVPSGLAALLVATEPMWIALLAIFTHKQRPNFISLVGLLLGFIGVVLLTTDKELAGASASLAGAVLIIFGTLTWSVGMLYSTKSKALPAGSLDRAATSVLVGSAMLLVAAAFSGEFRGFHVAQVSAKSALGLLYLIVLGSIVAFTAYMWLMERCSPSLIATHTYVNPIVAVYLGWALAGEAMDMRTLAATVLVVISVICVSLGQKEPEPTPLAGLDEVA